jgi:hypothetical protein
LVPFNAFPFSPCFLYPIFVCVIYNSLYKLNSVHSENQRTSSSVSDVDPHPNAIITKYYFQHTPGIHTPVGNSEILTQDFSSVRLPTRYVTYLVHKVNGLQQEQPAFVSGYLIDTRINPVYVVTYLRSILILSCHLHLTSPRVFFTQYFRLKSCMYFLSLSCVLRDWPIYSSLICQHNHIL